MAERSVTSGQYAELFRSRGTEAATIAAQSIEELQSNFFFKRF